MPALSSSSALINDLQLQEHPEGGYFVVTNVQKEKILSPFAEGKPRELATSIYYFLTYDRPIGLFHMNKSVTYHVLHQGRAEYTLITPGNPPTIEKKVMGTNAAAGETRMLVVGTGIWKRSSLLEEDLQKARAQNEQEQVNCLITEVVVPGFDWEDHVYMYKDTLEKLFEGVEGGDGWVKEFSQF
ncbi:RmlC-like cupin domain-containing protein, partial [Pholiota molesta]